MHCIVYIVYIPTVHTFRFGSPYTHSFGTDTLPLTLPPLDLNELLKKIKSKYLLNLVMFFTHSGIFHGVRNHMIQLKSLRPKFFLFGSAGIVNVQRLVFLVGSWYMSLCLAVAQANLNLSKLFIEFVKIALRNLKTKFRQAACSITAQLRYLSSLNYFKSKLESKSCYYIPKFYFLQCISAFLFFFKSSNKKMRKIRKTVFYRCYKLRFT